ncbi:unnamed protein product [Blepharisma stoltei]|uniref:Phosphatase 2A Regulatory Subunit A helical domain-containing protein n=1 Tax=Blepharisma stoltei TaxID=1481888 RepID=A0AAU9IF35_9CILI|nr:unnamed protein product [Blepharisma stoltei]
MMDETVVREQAVKSLISISNVLPDSDIINLLVPCVLKLSAAENFSSRISAVTLFGAAYPRSGNFKEKLRQKFLELSHEDTPMVRRAAVIEMGIFAKVVEKQFLISELIPDIRQLAQDEQDQVRTLCVDSMIEVARLLNKEENKLHTLPIILLVGEDKSWRVRYHFAQKFPQLAEALGKEITENSLIQTFVQLLRDIEADVKSIALHSLKSTMNLINREKIQNLVFPTVEAISSDVSLNPKVRKNCAEVIAEMVQYVGREFASSKIAPIALVLMSDESFEVKMKMVEGLGNLASVIGTELLSPPIINQMVSLVKESPQWRLRKTVIKSCVDITRHLGEEAFIRHLQPIYMSFLTDPVNDVREAGIEELNILATVMTPEWTVAEFLTKLEEIYHSQANCIARITILRAMGSIYVNPDQYVPIFNEAARDKVANVRLILCKVIKKLSSKIDVSQFRNLLQDLSRDADKDVKYYAQQALR